MATYELRPMSVGEILDGSFAVYRRIFGTLISIVIVCQALPATLNTYVEQAGGFISLPILALVALLLWTIGGLVGAGATVRAISESYLGRRPELGRALRYALGKAVRLLVAGMVKYFLIILAAFVPALILVGLGFLFRENAAAIVAVAVLASVAFTVPPVIVACGYGVVTQAVILEPIPGTAALGRSWWLTNGHKGRAFVLGLVIFVLMSVPWFALTTLAVASPALLDREQALLIITVAIQLVTMVIYPLVSCVFTLFYYDLRVRKEAFDLEHLSRQLSEAPGAA